MRDGVTRLLVLPGEHPPPPLGGYILAEEVRNKASQMTEQFLMSNVSTLMSVCCLMLTNSYPVKVLFSSYNVFLQLTVSSVYLVWKKNDKMQLHY